MRLVYFGTPDDAVPPLDALLAAGHDVAFVVTQPDRRRTRGKGTDPTPVKQAAIERGLPVYTPEKAREVVDEVAASGAEIGVVVAFGQLLPDALFEAVPLGFVNIHFSLLPRWRGAAPVERAILAGDVETGVGLMQIDTGLDTGPVFAQARVPIEPDDTAGTLRGRLVELGSALLVENLPRLAQMTPLEQDGEPTYADKLDVEEFQLDPNQPARILARLVRAGAPRPGAWFVAGGKRVKVNRAEAIDATVPIGVVNEKGVMGTAQGALQLDEVQPEGKRAMRGADWRRGIRAAVAVEPA
ncbi:MAG: methionyl-tRNA formyltransferase [Acidimicrobiia bacterium]